MYRPSGDQVGLSCRPESNAATQAEERSAWPETLLATISADGDKQKDCGYDRQNFQAFHLPRFSGIAVATLPESVSRFNRFRSTSSSLAD